MDGPDETAGIAARTKDFLQRRARQGLRIARRALGLQPAPQITTAAARLAARIAAVQSDEEDEAAALAVAARHLDRLSSTVVRLQGEISLCEVAALRPMRRAEVGEMMLAETTNDVSGVLIGDGVLMTRSCQIERSDEDNLVVLAPNVRLSKVSITLRGSGNLVYVGPDTRLSNVVIKAVGEGNVIAIGRDVTFESGSLLCERWGRSLLLGDDCMVSNSVVVRTSDHHAIFERSTGTLLNPSADVVIGPHVWLGNGCRINKATRIGAGTVVGQNAIASGDLERNCIYAGVPARKLRDDVVWSRTESLESVPTAYR